MAKMQSSTPLMLTEGKGEDIVEEEEEKDESEEEKVPVKKKGKATISKEPKTIVFTRRTRGKAGKGDVVFKKPPPTFKENIKNLREGLGMANFRSLKYEIKIDAEQKEVEEVVIKKMGQWKYSANDMASQILGILLDKVRIRWENAR